MSSANAKAGISVGAVGRGKEVKTEVDGYEKYHSSFGGDVSARKADYADMVNKYYDLATEFYEYGWGESFHFAHQWKDETLREAIKRHEHYLALKLKMGEGHKVLDVGCGIGGPLREIASFTGAHITGLNNNEYQLKRADAITKKMGRGLPEICDWMKADFMNIPQKDASYDLVYEIEATCHAPDPVACYSEVLRVLKPGGYFAGYEWCTTDNFDPNDPEHIKAKQEIELGNGLPTTRSTHEVIQALKDAGFEVIEFEDLVESSEVTWFDPIDPDKVTIKNFKTSWVGRWATTYLCWWLETLRIAPAGTCRVQKFLEKGADGLVAGGKLGIYTPMFFFLARRPEGGKRR